MGGGLMQLVAYGVQDIFLTGSPQITFFKSLYRRHTNFAVETSTIPVDQSRPAGKTSTILLRSGDLCTKIYLHYQLPDVTAAMIQGGLTGGVTDIAYARRPGHALIDNVDLSIGGTRIDRHYGYYLDMWYELSHDFNKELGYEALIGDVPELTKMRPVPNLAVQPALASKIVINGYHLYIPLQFWFCRNNGLALPLIALQFHEVKIDVSLNSLPNLLVYAGNTSPVMSGYSFGISEFMIDYVFLDTNERRRFAQSSHEYLIEQVQNPSVESLSGPAYRGKPTFAHPTKELIWCLKVGAFSGGSSTSSIASNRTFLYYNHNSDDEYSRKEAIERAVKGIVESSIKDANTSPPANELQIPFESSPQDFPLPNGGIVQITFDTSDFASHTNTPTTLPPSGTTIANMVTSQLLGQVSNGFDYLKKVSQADLIISLRAVTTTVGSTPVTTYVISTVLCSMVEHTISLADLSVPLEQMDIKNRLQDVTVQKYSYHARDYKVTSCCNYGLDLEGHGNPFYYGNIQLNGKDRFDSQYGPYFNYIQTMAHTRTPANGINVYSFALYPEQHQPSGTCNFSRIDTIQFNFQVVDVLRYNNLGYSGPKFDYTTDSVVIIIARNYNVFRVMAGLGGIAYSN